MPNRTIYISDSDAQVIEKAQQLAGENLSATIVKALRRFIEMQEQEQDDYQEITVKVGRQVITQKQFVGRLLARGRFKGSTEGRVDVIQVYQTRKGAIAVYRRNLPAGPFGGSWDDETWPFNWTDEKFDKLREKGFKFFEKAAERMGSWDETRNEYTFDVFDGLEKIKDLVPEELYTAADQHLKHGPVEIMDI